MSIHEVKIKTFLEIRCIIDEKMFFNFTFKKLIKLIKRSLFIYSLVLTCLKKFKKHTALKKQKYGIGSLGITKKLTLT